MTNGNGITKTAADVEGLWNIRIPKNRTSEGEGILEGRILEYLN